MSIEYIELGPTPCAESCAQVGQPDFDKVAKIEMEIYIGQLYRMFPQAQEMRVWFGTKWFPHDFGRYGEVVAKWNDEDDSACKYVFDVIEKNLPEYWDEQAIAELEKAESK